ncbi:MAG: TRAP transporter small permease [Xanthobacteraceae bacterium]
MASPEMPRWLRPFDRRLVLVEDAFGAMAVVALVACAILICVDVVLRYIFSKPIVGGDELVEYALIYITFLGASWAVPRGAHIDIDVCVQAMPKFWQRVCAFLSNLISLGVAVVLTVFGGEVTWTAFMRGVFKPTTLQFPTWIVLLVIPIGSAVLAMRFLRETIVCADAIVTGRDIERNDQHRPTVD